MKVRNYEKDDILNIKAKKIFGESSQEMAKVVEQIHGEERNRIYTFEHEDSIVGIIGLSHMWKGVAEVWSVLSDDVGKQAITFQRDVLALIDMNQEEFKIKRYQLSVKRGYKEGYRWAGSLGFMPEGVMTKYDAFGNDHILFARIY